MESPAWMFTKALSHRQKVMRLYKRAIRVIDSWYGGDVIELRYQKVLMRARFDANKDVPDPRKSQLLLADGCRQLWEMKHFKPFRFASDPGGSSYDRERQSSDQILDSEQWTLAEREQFPYYFNRREERKKELLKFWDKIDKSWDEQIAAIQTELPKEKITSTTQ
uniref:NADH dehydrogenase [ubiquinone] 1 beta subcomplex subunit 9 n=1 Tax=Strongyloides stercoralis TaxID=6248 RepID=A0A0K0DXS8_STRER